MNKDYEVIIVGGGLVGLTLACALARLPLSVAVIDRASPSQAGEGNNLFELRVSAVTRASQHIFEALGVWSAIQAGRVSPYRQMEVWEAGGSAIRFDSADINQENLGYIIENGVMQRALLEKLQTFENVTLLYGVDFRDFSCELLVGADGANSQVRLEAGISTTEQDYGQSALVTTVRTALPHQETARQIFLPTGPLAFLPLSEPHTCSIVWSTSEPCQDLDTETFKVKLTEAFEYRLGIIEEVAERVVFPLRMRHADAYVKTGVALIGDAAHTLHPLAGQGLNLGLLDAACLAEVIQTAFSKQRPIGSLSTLRRYERWRKGHNLAMIAAMQGFKSLFASPHSYVQQVRSLGLQMTDSFLPVKKIFMRQAMGLTGDLPEMAQGLYGA